MAKKKKRTSKKASRKKAAKKKATRKRSPRKAESPKTLTDDQILKNPSQIWTLHFSIENVNQRRFLAAFTESMQIAQACEAAGVHRSNFYYWLANDTVFAAAFEHAKEQSLVALEDEARRRAVEGVRDTIRVTTDENGQPMEETVKIRYSDPLLMFLMKGLAPERYRDNYDATRQQAGGATFEQKVVAMSPEELGLD